MDNETNLLRNPGEKLGTSSSDFVPVSPLNACLISTCDRSKRHPLRPLLHTVHFTTFFQSERGERCSAQ